MNQPLPWSAQRLFTLGFSVELGLVLVAALLGLLAVGSPFPFTLRIDGPSLVWGLAGTVPTAILGVLFTSRVGRRLRPLMRIYEKLREIIGEPLRDLAFWELILLAGAAGVGEEVLFRGVIQGLLGLEITSVLFGLLHALTPTYFILASGIGFYLGWLGVTTGNLMVPILVHWLYDATALFLLRRAFEADAGGPAGRTGEGPGTGEPSEVS